MERLKVIIRWTIGIVIAVYLILALSINIHAVQVLIADTVASVLSKELGTRVEIGRIQLGFNGRIIIDDIIMDDQNGVTMLRVSRMGTKVNLWELLESRIRLGNVQLFGMRAELYQETASDAPNFQFVVDALTSEDSTKTTQIDLYIGQILVRRTNVRWEQKWKEEKPGILNVAHLSLENLNATAELNALTDDTLNFELKRLDVTEGMSGLCIKSLNFDVVANRQMVEVTDFCLSLPNSSLEAKELSSTFGVDGKTLSDFSVEMDGHIESGDIKAFSPVLAAVDDKIDFSLRAIGSQDRLSIDELKVSDTMLEADINLDGTILNLNDGLEKAVVEVNILNSSINPQGFSQIADIPILDEVGEIGLYGLLELEKDKASAEVCLATRHGDVEVNGTLAGDSNYDINVRTDAFQLSELTDTIPLGMVSLNTAVQGKLGDNIGIKGEVSQLEYNGYCYKNIEVDGNIIGNCYEGSVSVGDENLCLKGCGKVDLSRNIYALNAEVRNFEPNKLHLTERFPDTRFSGQLIADVKGNVGESAEGYVYLNGFEMQTSEMDYKPGDIHVTATHDDEEQLFTVISPFLEAQIEGKYKPINLLGDIKHLLGLHAPTLIGSSPAQEGNGEYCTFLVRVYDMRPLRQLAGIDIEMEHTAVLEGSMDMEASTIGLTARTPHLRYGKEDIKDISLRIEGYEKTFLSSLRLRRRTKGTYVDFGFEATGLENYLTTKFFWDNNNAPALKGDINILLTFDKDEQDRYYTEGRIQPSDIVMGDSVWHVQPGAFSYCNGVLDVDGFSIANDRHYLAINGHISNEETDTLHASLQNINLDNIFSLINFHAVEFGGEASGDVYAHSLFSKPNVDFNFHVPHFSINDSALGELDMNLNWGRREYSIYLDGIISSGRGGGHSRVSGYVTPKKDVAYHGLDLSIEADTLNICFLNKYIKSVFNDMQGESSGYVHLFGPFKKLNVEGGLLVHKGSIGIPYLGVRYYVVNDSVKLTPNNFYFPDANLFDPQYEEGKNGHRAKLNGHLTHSNFSNFTYDINIRGDNLLAYNFRDFGDLTFCGTVLATGDVSINGGQGQTNIDIKAQPQQGTAITYDFTSPDKVEQAQFVTYIDRGAPEYSQETVSKSADVVPENDVRLNFDLNLDNSSTINLLMDAKSGDMITVNGWGHILARYYNKGSMQMFGTYHIEKGTYNLSLQEIIHKNFDLQNGGTIVFTGEPLNADLDIQASHTVSGVSLNDISARSTFSNTSARVNCLMNITGKASQPYVTFDFDILNVNEDEKQMVRSLISTEEERNMQVIYLLGIGRFYTYDYSNTTQSQSSTAVNSLLSSTLSGQLNQMLSNMINNSNWNFGANVNTGTTGWSDLDVEGMLQGSLLNDRLLINGNFGYRDNPINSSNFIGDFNAQYHLTRSGSVSLKAYNETNDRYFTKTSLTTQGIGVLLKKDFSTMRDLFFIRARMSKDEKPSNDVNAEVTPND